jgi:hypothetical protein
MSPGIKMKKRPEEKTLIAVCQIPCPKGICFLTGDILSDVEYSQIKIITTVLKALEICRLVRAMNTMLFLA